MTMHFVCACILCLLYSSHTQCYTKYESKPAATSTSSISTTNPVYPDPNRPELIKSYLTHRQSRSTVNQLPSEQFFIKKVFEKFSENGDTMTLNGFEKLLRTIGLENVIFKNTSNNKNHSSNLNNNYPSNSLVDHKKQDDNFLNQTITCLTGEPSSLEGGLNQESLTQLCPSILYQLAGRLNGSVPHCVEPTFLARRNEIKNPDEPLKEEVEKQSQLLVWLYSTLSILVISLCGLLGVAVIPIMQKVFYQQLIQFLVALAIGTLTGDALIHLLPHAMGGDHEHSHPLSSSSSHDHEEMESHHRQNVWVGFVAAAGIFFFFFTEKCLNLIGEWHKKYLKKKRAHISVRVMREENLEYGGGGPPVTGDKLCKHKYSSYPYCYGEITTDMTDGNHKPAETANCKEMTNSLISVVDEPVEIPLTFTCTLPSPIRTAPKALEEECLPDGSIMGEEERVMLPGEDPLNAGDGDAITPIHERQNAHQHGNPSHNKTVTTVILREHENQHHGHSHSHGHVHSAPDNLSSVAWMVIMGDGLHNFTDGMAIGAAFASSLPGGFSTAVAVFCHELPHEVGDFAVLLKAGMSGRQAVFYNMLSSVLCLFGMVLGIFVGENHSASRWMFALAAGMFLYIALVDMIPELTSSHKEEGSSLLQCALQCLGLLAGYGIMLLIAAYEHQLRNVFASN